MTGTTFLMTVAITDGILKVMVICVIFKTTSLNIDINIFHNERR